MVNLEQYENEYFLTHKSRVDTTLREMTWAEVKKKAYEIADEINKLGYEKAIITSEDYMISALETELLKRRIEVYYPVVRCDGDNVILLGLLKVSRRVR